MRGRPIINANGRICDPHIGRFLTPDPIIQAPFWSQGLNAYSYAFNNPLKFVDPSGFQTMAIVEPKQRISLAPVFIRAILEVFRSLGPRSLKIRSASLDSRCL